MYPRTGRTPKDATKTYQTPPNHQGTYTTSGILHFCTSPCEPVKKTSRIKLLVSKRVLVIRHEGGWTDTSVPDVDVARQAFP